MMNLIIETSKYLMILLMACYTYFNFRFFSFRDIWKKRAICARQNQAMFMLHLLAYLIIYLKTGEVLVLIFYAAQVVFFLAYIYLYRLFYRNVSRLLVNNACMLMCVGLIMLTRISLNRAIRQFILIAASAVITWLVPWIIDHVWQLSRAAWLYAVIGLGLLGVVCLTGTTTFGAQLSLEIHGISFQPSEFVKITFVFFAAAMFYRSVCFKTVAVTTTVAAAHVLILVLSKDLGSALLFFVAYVFMLFVATSNWLYLGAGMGSGALAALVAYRWFPHVQTRVSAWSDPWSDIDKNGYQIAQSLFAIGTGGWFGMGLYQGMPYKIPVVEKDFIFAAISEELGGIFALCVVLICIGCFLQFMMVAGTLKASFFKLIAFGLGIVYITQVFLTIGGVTKFIPSTGVTLPFVSYGGSSIFSTFLLFNIIQGLYILKRNEEEEDEEN
ncbi:MAG: FtsW/RodA/SpoVE family cell cycle protein [Lachnospiraceae bacterium]|nr:FtsW/RodA/SpoVE family cell cycle protein [Lachnospiraceae bacterium]